MSASSLLVLVLLVAISLGQVEGLFFLLQSDLKAKCFQIEQSRDTPIVFAYEILDAGHKVNFNLYYGNTPSTDLQILHKVFGEAVGHVDYVTDVNGFYTYCVSQSTPMDHATRFKITVNYGYDTDYYEKISKEQNYDAVNLEVRKLNDLMAFTLNEADYQKHKEVIYHSQTERMNSDALWWPILQITILVIIGIFQVQHLKIFFKANKLI
jgi:p24 family protein alpha